jgi:putative oxidoreductase
MNHYGNYLAVSGRALLALMFALSGVSKLADVSGTAGYMASAGLPAWQALAFVAGLFEVLAALALALGWKAREAALALALFTLGASVLFHNFWSLPPDQQFIQQLMFLKNLSVAGGMLMVAALGAGPLSLDARIAKRIAVAAH